MAPVKRKITPTPDPAPLSSDIDKVLSAMRDSVWVIQHELTNDHPNKKDLISRNTSHLKLMMTAPEIAESKQDLSDINAAIEAGESYLSSLED